MKKILCKLDIKTLLILLLIIVIILMRACGGGGETSKPGQTVYVQGKPYEVIKHVRDTVYVDKKTVITKPGKDIYHDVPVYVEVPKKVDTAQILKDYYSSVTYKDTLKLNDNLGVVSITDVISKNKIQSRSFVANVKERTITDTLIIKEKAKRQLYFGINSSFNKQDIVSSVGAGFMYKDRKDKVFTLGIGAQQTTSNTLTPYLQGGLYWKIKLKK